MARPQRKSKPAKRKCHKTLSRVRQEVKVKAPRFIPSKVTIAPGNVVNFWDKRKQFWRAGKFLKVDEEDFASIEPLGPREKHYRVPMSDVRRLDASPLRITEHE